MELVLNKMCSVVLTFIELKETSNLTGWSEIDDFGIKQVFQLIFEWFTAFS